MAFRDQIIDWRETSIAFLYNFIQYAKKKKVMHQCNWPIKPDNTHHTAGVANANKFWRNVPPDADTALSDALTRRQLQKKQRQTDQRHQQHIQQDECSWKTRNNTTITDEKQTWIWLASNQKHLLLTHLLRSGGRGTGTSKRFPIPHWIPPERGNTPACCPSRLGPLPLWPPARALNLQLRPAGRPQATEASLTSSERETDTRLPIQTNHT